MHAGFWGLWCGVRSFRLPMCPIPEALHPTTLATRKVPFSGPFGPSSHIRLRASCLRFRVYGLGFITCPPPAPPRPPHPKKQNNHIRQTQSRAAAASTETEPTATRPPAMAGIPARPGVQGSGFRVQGSGFRVQGSGFRVLFLGFRV